ncbi:hypothetical protein GCM10011514_19110 [Emticicia aquatilis]|uniref:DUF4440 domain-containing protein n=1 Tax=Emticicia aquatilis TaxID=1537369 RepID=A0A916YQ45_9BACT|nr:nuclear transport factor 2 family protein [Emticicia aquatilis]GGD55086.1 hypothetical protein GCM10011514_19110 [Emticicia aquatilis]
MKKIGLFIGYVFFSLLAKGQENKDEAEIRRLEDAERVAVLKQDLVTLNKIWDKDFTVNNPANVIVTRQQVEDFIKSDEIKYERFDRIVEKIIFRGNIAIAMGNEVIKPLTGQNIGQIINRRYTDIWFKENKSWRMLARHANVIVEIGK